MSVHFVKTEHLTLLCYVVSRIIMYLYVLYINEKLQKIRNSANIILRRKKLDKRQKKKKTKK